MQPGPVVRGPGSPTGKPGAPYFQDGLRELLDTRCGLPVAGIQFLDRALVLAGAAEVLPVVGLDASALIEFEVMDGAGYAGHGSVLRGAASFAAFTSALREGNGGVSHYVFVQNALTDPGSVEEQDRAESLALQQLGALAHELGHIADMRLEINFRFNPPRVWLADAEAEAHAAALEYLGARWPAARDRLAGTLMRALRVATAPHEQALCAALIARVGRKKLEAWTGG